MQKSRRYVNESCLSSKILILTGQQTIFYVLAFQLRDLAQVFVKEYFALVNGEINEVSCQLTSVNYRNTSSECYDDNISKNDLKEQIL